MRKVIFSNHQLFGFLNALFAIMAKVVAVLILLIAVTSESFAGPKKTILILQSTHLLEKNQSAFDEYGLASFSELLTAVDPDYRLEVLSLPTLFDARAILPDKVRQDNVVGLIFHGHGSGESFTFEKGYRMNGASFYNYAIGPFLSATKTKSALIYFASCSLAEPRMSGTSLFDELSGILKRAYENTLQDHPKYVFPYSYSIRPESTRLIAHEAATTGGSIIMPLKLRKIARGYYQGKKVIFDVLDILTANQGSRLWSILSENLPVSVLTTYAPILLGSLGAAVGLIMELSDVPTGMGILKGSLGALALGVAKTLLENFGHYQHVSQAEVGRETFLIQRRRFLADAFKKALQKSQCTLPLTPSTPPSDRTTHLD
jgi:hypothetical protein